MSIRSYAQNFEDVMLWRALSHIRHGFYIDIGAQDPLVDSVSRAFYEQGWRGLHVEPTTMFATALKQNRPDETVLQVAIGSAPGQLRLFEFPHTGLSTGMRDIALQHQQQGHECVETRVDMITLDNLLKAQGERAIHWLKIDVEGMEGAVLAGWQQAPQRPWIIVIESTRPGGTEASHQDWEAQLLAKGYQFVYFDGVNRFYVADQHPELAAAFTVPPNVFDEFVLSGLASHAFCHHLKHQIHLAEVRASAANEEAYQANQRVLTLEQALRDSRACADRATQHSQLIEQELRNIRLSRSWRWTAPLRRMARGLCPRLLQLRPSSLYLLLSAGLRRVARMLEPYPRLRRNLISMIRRFPWLYERLSRQLRRVSPASGSVLPELPAEQAALNARARLIKQRLRHQTTEKHP
jgi:FkbM family methyltransferase